MKSVVSIIALCLFFTSSLANGDDSLDDIIADHAAELSAIGNDVAAYRLLDRITNLDEGKFDKSIQLKTAIANKLLFHGEAEKQMIKADTDLNTRRQIVYKFNIDSTIGAEETVKLVYLMKGIFHDALRSETEAEPKLAAYPSNSTIVVSASLRDHLRLMLIANSPILADRWGTKTCTEAAEPVQLTNASSSAAR